jgi:hypothetical protein
VDVPVDEAGHDDPIGDVRHRHARVPGAGRFVGPEVDDHPVVDDEQAVGVEAGGLVFGADVPPRIVDEVQERSAFGRGRHGQPLCYRCDDSSI